MSEIQTSYYLAENGKPNGPYNMSQLSELKEQGRLTPDTYVWQEGMQNWAFAKDRTDLKSLFSEVLPPPIPSIPGTIKEGNETNAKTQGVVNQKKVTLIYNGNRQPYSKVLVGFFIGEKSASEIIHIIDSIDDGIPYTIEFDSPDKAKQLLTEIEEAGGKAHLGDPDPEDLIPKVFDAKKQGVSDKSFVEIPEGCTEIADHSFGCGKVERVVFPSTLKKIGKRAFASCVSLKTLDFSKCTQLENIDCEGKPRINSAFSGCENLESIIFPPALKDIGGGAFKERVSLKTLDFSLCTQLKEIAAWAFSDCKNLESIIFPPALKFIGQGAFARCVSLKTFDFSKYTRLEIIGEYAFESCEQLETAVILPSSLKEIGDSAFDSCANLKKVDLSKCNKLESIGSYTFGWCEKLTEIDFSNCVSLKHCGGDAFKACPNIRTIDFSGCTSLSLPVLNISDNLEKLILPPGQKTCNAMFVWDQFGYPVDTSKCTNVKVVAEEAFAGMSMKEIIIPDTVETIGENAFDKCENLKTIVMPAALKEIKAPLGTWLEQLKKVDFSKVTQLRTIPKKLFNYHCDKLKELMIPNGVTEIEDDAFEWVEKLKRLFLPPTLESIGDLELTNVSIYCFSPSLEELEPLVYGWDDDDDDDDLDDDDLEDLDEDELEELKDDKKDKKKMKINLYVLPQYLENYVAQRKAERIPEDVLIIQEIPEEYRYYYDN